MAKTKSDKFKIKAVRGEVLLSAAPFLLSLFQATTKGTLAAAAAATGRLTRLDDSDQARRCGTWPTVKSSWSVSKIAITPCAAVNGSMQTEHAEYIIRPLGVCTGGPCRGGRLKKNRPKIELAMRWPFNRPDLATRTPLFIAHLGLARAGEFVG